MCEVSDKLKLCTCNTDIGKLKNWWAFYRFEKGKNDFLIGEPMMPSTIPAEIDSLNRDLLTRLLNDGNVFDFDLKPKSKDCLLLTFRVPKKRHESGIIQYGYVYKNRKWVEIDFKPFSWEEHHNEEITGKILNAMKNNFDNKEK